MTHRATSDNRCIYLYMYMCSYVIHIHTSMYSYDTYDLQCIHEAPEVIRQQVHVDALEQNELFTPGTLLLLLRFLLLLLHHLLCLLLI